ncbi:pupal cuticle protein Edg-91 [Plutella xylostella]|uniref:pupal cuticle protein Edg-91 n=1 Tax=Plutella xylostella TaxID=51655 RepID=UPI0020330302|nr:pupal cuticle protein Edg-91 [Plutella xylostella]XP_037969065.2 pupal cuticle protein Edg-91 [Plutella xylostella]
MRVSPVVLCLVAACALVYAGEAPAAPGPVVALVQAQQPQVDGQLAQAPRQKRGLLLGLGAAGALGAGALGVGALGVLGAKAIGAGLIGGALASKFHGRSYGGYGGYGGYGHYGGYSSYPYYSGYSSYPHYGGYRTSYYGPSYVEYW